MEFCAHPHVYDGGGLWILVIPPLLLEFHQRADFFSQLSAMEFGRLEISMLTQMMGVTDLSVPFYLFM